MRASSAKFREPATGFPFIVMILAAVFTGCSGSSESAADAVEIAYRYAPNAEMTSAWISTANGDLSVLTPAGWEETVDQKNAPNVVLWLVKEDYSTSLSFTPMNMDPALYDALKKDGVLAVAKVSLSMKKDNAKKPVTVIQQPETFILKSKAFAAYEYTIDGSRTIIRVVVFDTGKRFMECALLPATNTITPAENRRLFETQQSVLASMVVK